MKKMEKWVYVFDLPNGIWLSIILLKTGDFHINNVTHVGKYKHVAHKYLKQKSFQ